MKEVVVLSGKGGTGKTSITGSFAALAQNKVLVDCDVDAADLHLILDPRAQQEYEFWSGQLAVIDPEKCTKCDACRECCRFEAVKDYRIDPVSCEGCGFCSHICPAGAITMKDSLAGKWFISDTRYGCLVHARLGIAQENSGKLVTTVRKEARNIAEKDRLDIIISDGPPGIGCPVISSLSGADLAVLVTEPTLSGIHDLERVLEVCRHFDVKALVCINKYDINEENTAKIENYCQDRKIQIAARIPFDNIVTEAMIKGKPVVEISKGRVSKEIASLWDNIYEALKV
ncbi:MAG: 4Fe-4S binding protein [Dehalococcoidales bacterium]|nr:4Fe-4S binding protein [Dehalococcoidales bacterium]